MKIVFEVPDHVAENLKTVVQRCAREESTHGILTLKSLFEMLAEDVAMMESRPGSWEGSNMTTVFISHGYYH